MEKTFKKSKTRFESICGHAVSYDVIEDDTSWGVSISAANLSCNRAIKATDLNIRLLNKDHSPLREIDPVESLCELSSVTFKGIASYFKLAHYEKTGEEPVYLAIRLFDSYVVSDFDFLDGKITDAEERNDSTFIGYYGRIPICCCPPPPPPPPPDRCCCVESFDTPSGNLATNVTPMAGGRVMLQPDPWIIRAQFKNDDSCKCEACEYRQEIKGQITAAQPGFVALPVHGFPPLDFQPPQQPGGKPIPVYIDPNVFQEDSIGDPQNPGTPLSVYGYKPTKNPGKENYRDNGCSYWALDEPSTTFRPPIPKGTVISISVTFKGYIKDVECGGDKEEKTWNWVQNYTW